MNKIFRKVNGDGVNVVEHTLEVLKKYPSVEIHIGTDSQVYSPIVKYASVIAYKYGPRGVHYIVSKQTLPFVKRDSWTRLWKEAEFSIEIAEWLTSKINVKVKIDMDYNEDETFLSSKLIPAAKGYAQSLGYTVNIKPNEDRFAVFAADYEC